MRTISLLVPVVGSLMLFACSNGQIEAEPVQENPVKKSSVKPMLPAHPLPGERNGAGKADQFDDYKLGNPSTYGITTAPKTPVRAIAQWEPAQALLLTWTGNFPSVYGQIIQASKPVVDVYVIHEGNQSKYQFQNAMSQYGYSISGVKYLNMKNNSIWVRDYGPLSVRTPDGKVAFTDPRYYHERVYDDAIPTLIANQWNMTVYRQPLKWEGGTYIADGYGNCYYSQGVYWYGGTSESQIHKYQKQYLGCDTNIVLKPLSQEGTTHSDMFAKLVNKNHMILGEYKSWQDSTNKQLMDDNEDILTSATLNDGGSVSVTRIPMPSNNSKTVWRTYANSLFVNGVNLIPVYSDDTTYENQAMDIWQQAMPNWQHVKIDSKDLITWSGAIHCITMTVGEGTLASAETPGPSGLCNGSFNCFPSNTYGDTCSLDFEGCCDDSTLNTCKNGSTATTSCGNQGCGWNSSVNAYGCGGAGAGPANAPLSCNSSCTPDCTGKTCGSDGCSGTCGTCTNGQTCKNGQCVTPNDPCDGISVIGCCSNNTLKFCQSGQLTEQSCGNNDCGWDAGGNGGNGWYDCGGSGADPSGTYALQCPGTCTPSCNGNQCGDDGCGGSCGTCAAGQNCTNGQCVCAPNCTNKSCGDDGCGGSCGTCSNGQTCTDGQCVCTPNCVNKTCGSDGCNGVCGTCAAGQTCTDSQCVTSNTGCGNVTFEGMCDGNVLKWCKDNTVESFDCATLGNYVCKAKPNTNPPDYGCLPIDNNCVPDCNGKTCGANGCGGVCGQCGENQNCIDNQCVDNTPVDECGGLKYEGCCDGNVVTWCENGKKQTVNCDNGSCGWDPQGNNGNGYYNCNKTADGPPEFPKECGAQACTPDCNGKTCGDDGCGGACGTCTGGQTCQNSQCVDGFEAGGPCGDISYEGTCKGTQLAYCSNGKLEVGDCQQYSGYECCGWNANNGFYDCVPVSQCTNCENECSQGEKGCSLQTTHQWICEKDATGSCWERVYTLCDGASCDAATNACPAPPTCVPDCNGKQCGSDGCDSTCGTCGAGESCNGSGQCVAGCTPNCSGKMCGDDGCGGTCGTCEAALSCVNSQCIPAACNPKCDGKVCGDDSCGGSCGDCSSGKVCDKFGQCVDDQSQCTPNCEGKTCGPDGCEGNCGVCGKSQECVNGQCVENPTNACGDIPVSGVCNGNVLNWCTDSGSVGVIDCGAQGLVCGQSPGVGFDCVPDTNCVPNCNGKPCGSDGCGGVCGLCPKDFGCTPDGQCVSNTCEPQCNDRQCGSDLCGGSCGVCSEGELCSGQGLCISTTNPPPTNRQTPTTTGAQTGDGCGCVTSAGGPTVPSSGGLLLAILALGLALTARRFMVGTDSKEH
jgi:agmatine/peptidylarginine deiminase